MPEVRKLTVLGSYLYESIPLIADFVAEAAHLAGLSPDDVFHCQMAADEACTNVIEHAYGGRGDGNIDITCLVEDGKCTIEIVDYGQPFDPAIVPEPKVADNLDELEPGGIGLHLMRKLMDSVVFDFSGPGNKLTMIKTRPRGGRTAESEMVKTQEMEDGIWLVSCHGRLDAAHAPELEAVLTGLIEKGLHRIVVDLGEVDYISSRGLKTLVSAWRTLNGKGGNLVLSALAPRVLSIFDTVGFTQIFDIYDLPEEALLALSSQEKRDGSLA